MAIPEDIFSKIKFEEYEKTDVLIWGLTNTCKDNAIAKHIESLICRRQFRGGAFCVDLFTGNERA